MMKAVTQEPLFTTVVFQL